MTPVAGQAEAGPAGAPDTTAAAVFAEQVRLLFRLSRPAYGGTLAVAVIMLVGLWTTVPAAHIAGWFALVIVITAARFVLYRQYVTDERARATGYWSSRFLVGAVAMGGMWGVLGSLLLPAEFGNQLLIVFIVAGMVASGLIVLTPVKSAFVGFTLPALLPLIAAMLAQGDGVHVYTGAILAAFLVVMLAACPIVHSTHVTSLRMRFDNADLVERLSAANRLADDANRQLSFQLAEQKKIEEALQQSTDRVEALIDASPLAIVEFDEQLKVDRWNPAAERMFGWSKQEVLDKPTPLVPPNLLEEARAHRTRIFSGETFANIETVRLRKDGTLLNVSVSAAAIYNSAGDAVGMVAMFADIGERKRAAESQARFAAIVENSYDAIVSRTLDRKIDTWNSAAEQLFGYSAAEMIGENLSRLVPDEHRAEAAENRVLVEQGHAVPPLDTVRLAKDGTRIDVSMRQSPIRDVNGGIIGVSVIFRDISERKRDRQALQQSSARLEALVAASPLGIIVQDEQGVIKRWNQAAERIFGWTEGEAIGQKMLAVPTDRKSEGARFRELILGGAQLADVEAVRKRKDGQLITVSLSAAPLRDAAGVANGMVLIVADISGRKRAEQLQQLEHTVTRLLAESRTVDDAIPQVLRAFGELTGWAYGARWVLQSDQRLRCQDSWHEPTPQIAAFAEFNRKRRQALGNRKDAGLLRRVWSESEPAWVANIVLDASLQRTGAALQAGLKCGFGFPILIAGKFYGVMEFFAREERSREDDLLRVAASIGSQIGQFIARKEAESNLTFFANHDTLTGLPNRAMFNQRLAQALARAHRYSKLAAVLFVDLDRFKNINDTLGHDAGDQLLKQLSGRLRESLREGDTVGRQGGDEFVVLIEDVNDPNQLTGVAQKMLETIAQPYMIVGQEFHITASIGISIFPDDGRDQQVLLKNADIAMYRAKERGKNNYQFYSAQMNQHSFERLALETSLRRAVERNEFLLHYQPKVNMRSGRITGVEALVRWRHPELGMVSPAQFIPLAEETGLIVQIGEWVLRTACRDARGWLDQGLHAVSVGVNLSARQFDRDDLASTITTVMRETGFDPRSLELEITESTVMRSADRAAGVLQQLKDIGVRVAIDDFGTGYSSLGYLKRFPIDSVKVDRSFILDIPDDKDDVAITCAVIAMAHSLRLQVVAEGVETAAQYAFLREQDCDEIQGYYFSQPIEAAALAGLLAQSSEEFKLA